MNKDLTGQTGFPLVLDPDLCTLTPGEGYRLDRASKSVRDLLPVLHAPHSLPPEQRLFYVDHLSQAPGGELGRIQSLDLSYGFTTLPPLKVGREYVKTHGHSHPAPAGQTDSFPEIYSVVSGSMWLFLQKYQPGNPGQLETCLLFRMTAGQAVHIPPNYAHMQINPSPDEPSVTAGLFNGGFKPEFDFYRRMGGFAYYILDGDGGVEFLPNPRYPHIPSMQIMDRWEATPFETPEAGWPLWTGFQHRPESFAGLSHLTAAGMGGA